MAKWLLLKLLRRGAIINTTAQKPIVMRNMISQLHKIGDTILGFLIGLGVMLMLISLGLAAYNATKKWDGYLYSQVDCIKLQQIENEIYKVNSCNGDVEPLEKE